MLRSPAWSPDGARIAFAGPDGDGSSIVIADIDGLKEETITGADTLHYAPRWSPDGRQIIFTRRPADRSEPVHVVGASGEPSAVDCRPPGST